MVTVHSATPVTIPEALTVATALSLLLQVPPEVASVSEVVPPTHVFTVPRIAAGIAGLPDTVTPRVTNDDPQELLAV
jgi:hypothetical protein